MIGRMRLPVTAAVLLVAACSLHLDSDRPGAGDGDGDDDRDAGADALGAGWTLRSIDLADSTVPVVAVELAADPELENAFVVARQEDDQFPRSHAALFGAGLTASPITSAAGPLRDLAASDRVAWAVGATIETLDPGAAESVSARAELVAIDRAAGSWGVLEHVETGTPGVEFRSGPTLDQLSGTSADRSVGVLELDVAMTGADAFVAAWQTSGGTVQTWAGGTSAVGCGTGSRPRLATTAAGELAMLWETDGGLKVWTSLASIDPCTIQHDLGSGTLGALSDSGDRFAVAYLEGQVVRFVELDSAGAIDEPETVFAGTASALAVAVHPVTGRIAVAVGVGDDEENALYVAVKDR